MTTLVDEQDIEETIRQISLESFTVLDFFHMFERLHPDAWKRLVERFGQFGEKRRYTVNTYFSNRLDIYSQKPDSPLQPFRRYTQAQLKDYRRATDEEQKHFGSARIPLQEETVAAKAPRSQGFHHRACSGAR